MRNLKINYLSKSGFDGTHLKQGTKHKKCVISAHSRHVEDYMIKMDFYTTFSAAYCNMLITSANGEVWKANGLSRYPNRVNRETISKAAFNTLKNAGFMVEISKGDQVRIVDVLNKIMGDLWPDLPIRVDGNTNGLYCNIPI